MTIAASGALRTAALRTEYGGGTPMRLGSYRRGHASGWVKKNAANNVARNLSELVPESTQPTRLGIFRGQAKGFHYTNTTIRSGAGGTHYHCHVEFGDDWTTSPWPCTYENYSAIGSNDTGTYALVIYGRSVGPFTFNNKSRIEGAGGAPNSGAGQHAIYMYNTSAAFKPLFLNSPGGAVRGGGGAGGVGGTGGQGGNTGYVVYEPGPYQSTYYYTRDVTCYRISSGSQYAVFWGGPAIYVAQASPGWPWQSDANTLYMYGPLAEQNVPGGPVNYNYYQMRRQYGATSGYGGAGGAGGNGGRGQGYNLSQQSGVMGTLGSPGWVVTTPPAPAHSTGSGGRGGTGGSGGTWGNGGSTGNVGATGNSGSSGSGLGGAAGAAGGAGGYSIYVAADCPWSLSNAGGTIQGTYGGGTAPS